MLKFYRISYIALLMFTAVMLALVLADSIIGNGTSGVFSSSLIIALLTAFAVLQIFCLVMMKPAFTLQKAGFYLLHLGLMFFLGGSFLFYGFGESVPVYMPVRENTTYNKIQRQDSNEIINLGFGLGVTDFKVEKYEESENKPASDKYYEANLLIENGTSLRQKNEKLIVNRPVHENGWKIYLMNYALSADGSYDVYLLLKRDPGEYVTDTGILMMLIGAFALCFSKKKEADE